MTLKQEGDNAYHVTHDFRFNSNAVRVDVTVAVVSGTGVKKGALVGVGCLKDDHHGYIAAVRTYGTWGIGPPREGLHLAHWNQHPFIDAIRHADPNRHRLCQGLGRIDHGGSTRRRQDDRLDYGSVTARLRLL